MWVRKDSREKMAKKTNSTTMESDYPLCYLFILGIMIYNKV